MRPFPWLTGHVVRSVSVPGLLAREAGAALQETRRRWWARVPFPCKLVLWAALVWLVLPWLLWVTAWYWDRVFGAGVSLEWTAPTR